MQRPNQKPGESSPAAEFELWSPAELIAHIQKLSRQNSGLKHELESMRQRSAQHESKFDCLEIDTERVHRFLDEFEVPRYAENDDSRGSAAQELSLLGRVELVLEDEDE